MELPAITRTLLAAKKMKGLTFTDLGKVVGRAEVWVAALCYRQATASSDEAQKLVEGWCYTSNAALVRSQIHG